MINASLPQLRAALDDKEISAVELATLFLDRIATHNPLLNAFITCDREATLAEALGADERLARGQAAPLTGIPLAHKDLFCTVGQRTTCGSKMLENFVSPYDAHVVSRLREAGAVSLGKTNMDEFAMGSTSESSYFGPTRNPWQHQHVAGGSSGGSAAAVAARLAPVATGSDTGGSVRQPAAFNGITGIKPTYGVCSRYGMVAYASSLDQAGALGRSAEDCAWLLSAMAGFDERDSTCVERPAAEYDYARLLREPRAGSKPLDGLRLGRPREFFAAGMAADVRTAVDAAIAHYEALGARIVDISLPQTALAVPAYYVIAPAEASTNLSRFDGVRFGHRAAHYGDLEDMYCKSRAEGFGDEVQRRILIGAYVLSHGYYDAYYLQAQKLRRLIAQDFATAFTQCDLIVGPVTPTTAWALGALNDDPVQMYLADIYTSAANLAGLPALAHPAGFGAGQLPIGVQLIGNYFSEARLLDVAHRYQQTTTWCQQRPVTFS